MSGPKKLKGGMKTLNDLGRDDGSDDDNDDRKTQDKYAGGASSGILVRGQKEVDGMFEKAKQNILTREDYDNEKKKKAKEAFRGTGNTLGDGVRGSEAVSQAEDTEEKMVDITFYQNGFVVNDGPLRAMDDPANKAFLEDINRGVVPRELGNRSLSITLHDNRNQKYTPPEPKKVPFMGAGNRLGTTESAPTTTTSSSSSSSSTAPTTQAAAKAPETGVDDSKETTTLQLRLADGTRLVAKFNVDQTVGDIRRFVTNAKPVQFAFDLQTAFPKQLLQDDNATITAAGLKNAVIIQAKKV